MEVVTASKRQFLTTQPPDFSFRPSRRCERRMSERRVAVHARPGRGKFRAREHPVWPLNVARRVIMRNRKTLKSAPCYMQMHPTRLQVHPRQIPEQDVGFKSNSKSKLNNTYLNITMRKILKVNRAKQISIQTPGSKSPTVHQSSQLHAL